MPRNMRIAYFFQNYVNEEQIADGIALECGCEYPCLYDPIGGDIACPLHEPERFGIEPRTPRK